MKDLYHDALRRIQAEDRPEFVLIEHAAALPQFNSGLAYLLTTETVAHLRKLLGVREKEGSDES